MQNHNQTFTFSDEERDKLEELIKIIKNKEFTNVYFFRDFKHNYHIFHHTIQNKETQEGFEEGIFTILKDLGIPFYLFIFVKGDRIQVDKINTSSNLYFTNLNHNLELL